jgi:ACS family pantothenate transporter-like MFS transporter
VAHHLSGTSFVTNPVMCDWATTIFRRACNDAARGVVLYTINLAGQLLYTWWDIVMHPATDMPYCKEGIVTMIVVCFAFLAYSFLVRWVCETTFLALKVS